LLPPISDPAKKVVVALPVQDSTGVAVSIKDIGMSVSLSGEGFSSRGYLNLSLVVQVNLSHKVSVVSATTSVVKEGVSIPGSPTTIKGEDFRVNGLTQSHKWPVWFWFV